jgi:hypothetical protein
MGVVRPFGAGATVRFLTDDAAGLWHAGELADDLGPESADTPTVRLLRLRVTGELVTIERPFERNLIERVERVER